MNNNHNSYSKWYVKELTHLFLLLVSIKNNRSIDERKMLERGGWIGFKMRWLIRKEIRERKKEAKRVREINEELGFI